MTLTQEQMNKALEEAPQKDVGEVDFDCPNCGTSLHETVYEHAWEVDEDGTITYDGPQATSQCKCGSSLLVAWQPDGEAELYWLNKKKMQTCSDKATEVEKHE